MPGDFICHRRKVIHPVKNRDVLVVVKILAELLKASVKVADIRDRLEDCLAVQCDENAQSGMCRRMLWAEIQSPQVFSVGTVGSNRLQEIQRHISPLPVS